MVLESFQISSCKLNPEQESNLEQRDPEELLLVCTEKILAYLLLFCLATQNRSI